MSQARILLLTTAAIVGIAIRLFFICGDINLNGDAGSVYYPLAHNLVSGNGFSTDLRPPYSPNSFSQPLYPLVLAGICFVTDSKLRAVVIIQVILELITLFLVAKICICFRLPPGIWHLSIVLGAICPFSVIYAARLMTETLATFTITLLLYCFVIAINKGEDRYWIAAGILSGLCILVRPDLLLAVALLSIVSVYFMFKKQKWSSLRHAAVLNVLIIVTLTPWMVRNYVTFKSLRPIGGVNEQNQLGYVKWLGTWLDDPRYLPLYWWQALDPSGPVTIPDGKLPNFEKSQAEFLLNEQKLRGAFDTQDKAFATLAINAYKERPFSALILVPLRRTILTWGRMPTYILDPTWKIIAYPVWLAGLVCVVVGGVKILCTPRTPEVLLIALVLGRTTLSLLSGIACEPRYMMESLPVCFILAVVGLYTFVYFVRRLNRSLLPAI